MAFGYSGARLALNYYMLEDGLTEADKLPAVYCGCVEILRASLRRYMSGELPVREMDELRGRVIREMEVITAYTDCFQIYEYVLNRMDRRFETDLPAVSENGIVEELMSFVVNSRDSVVMNGRIRQIIAQLPVRFTRKKFYAMVKEALTIYIGSERESLENLFYMLRTSAMTRLPEDMASGYEELDEILGQFRQADFKQMDGPGYQEAVRRITYVSERLSLLSSWYLTLQEIINDFYVLLLTKDRAMADVEEAGAVVKIIGSLLEHAKQGAGEVPEEELLGWLLELEGMQESYYEKYQRAVAAETEEAGDQSEEAQIARRLDLLLSGSSFAALEQKPSDGGVVDAVCLDQMAEQFFQELDDQFAGCQKPVARAIMATVLSELPVCFNRSDEVEMYIASSLSSCADHAEKETCIELLRQLVESENALV